jgi:hypothetical protein
MHIFNVSITTMQVWRMSAKRCGRSWLHKVGTLLKTPARPPGIHHSISRMHFVQPGQKLEKFIQSVCVLYLPIQIKQVIFHNIFISFLCYHAVKCKRLYISYLNKVCVVDRTVNDLTDGLVIENVKHLVVRCFLNQINFIMHIFIILHLDDKISIF